ncbi:hypothetical protein [Plasmodium yoelii yoelii]|uniref:Uncharacterized protein n=1 Tax=Plasmodium yoelii yoelii TaxID=73239 RepID=Q7RH70_PLAYO|nr:hypothetical protein [Plasmodium yoelii yoelii]
MTIKRYKQIFIILFTFRIFFENRNLFIKK